MDYMCACLPSMWAAQVCTSAHTCFCFHSEGIRGSRLLRKWAIGLEAQWGSYPFPRGSLSSSGFSDLYH